MLFKNPKQDALNQKSEKLHNFILSAAMHRHTTRKDCLCAEQLGKASETRRK